MENNMMSTDKKFEKVPQKKEIRRWILNSVSKATTKEGVTFHYIKRVLEEKQTGLSRMPEIKMILNNLIDSGRVFKSSGRYSVKKIRKSSKSKSNKKSRGSKSKSKNSRSPRKGSKGRSGGFRGKK